MRWDWPRFAAADLKRLSCSRTTHKRDSVCPYISGVCIREILYDHNFSSLGTQAASSLLVCLQYLYQNLSLGNLPDSSISVINACINQTQRNADLRRHNNSQFDAWTRRLGAIGDQPIMRLHNMVQVCDRIARVEARHGMSCARRSLDESVYSGKRFYCGQFILILDIA